MVLDTKKIFSISSGEINCKEYLRCRESATQLFEKYSKMLMTLLSIDPAKLNDINHAIVVYDGLELLIRRFHLLYNPVWVHVAPLINCLYQSGVSSHRNYPISIRGSFQEKYMSEITQLITKESLWGQLEQFFRPLDVIALLQDNMNTSLSGKGH